MYPKLLTVLRVSLKESGLFKVGTPHAPPLPSNTYSLHKKFLVRLGGGNLLISFTWSKSQIHDLPMPDLLAEKSGGAETIKCFRQVYPF